MTKLTKEQKKEIRQVIKKYLTSDERVGSGPGLVKFMAGMGAGGPLVFAADFFITGGLGTAAFVLGSASTLFGGALSGMLKLEQNQTCLTENGAGQEYKSKRIIRNVLNKMEWQLAAAFQKASQKELPYEEFKKIAAEIEDDAGKLSPAFKIVSGGPYGCRTDKYEFILDCERPEFKLPKIKTLSEEKETMVAATAAPTPPSLFKII